MDEAREALRRVFGFEDFRGVQADVVERVLAGRSTLAVMPTGAGKSLTYQLPATTLPGTCVVVSPLIALMHDQLRSARANGIRAATLTSVDAGWRETMDAFRRGELDLLYVAPERANQPQFRDFLSAAPLALFAVDEAHCVSEWGHDFRPDYRQLRPLLDSFPDVPRLTQSLQAANLAIHVNGLPKNLVLMGDFNSAAWSGMQAAFRAATGLDNRGHYLPSWPTFAWPIFRLPIDHVFVRGGARMTDLRLGPSVGSDHLPIEAEIGFGP